MSSSSHTAVTGRYHKRPLTQLDVQAKRVLVRVDYNVPLDSQDRVMDNTRIRETLPSLRWLLEHHARAVILASHLGRPKGKPVDKYRLAPVAKRLEELLGKRVSLAADCIGPEVQAAIATATRTSDEEVFLLENLRFHSGEEANDLRFAQALASLADCFVQEAFGAVHRAHASTVGVARLLPSAAGFLLQREIDYLSRVDHADHPFAAILGGAKVSDKIGVISSLLDKVDILVIGGAMAYTFLRAQGVSTGSSLVEPDRVSIAQELLEKARAKGVQILLPVDHQIAKTITEDAERRITEMAAIPEGWTGVDIGPATIRQIAPLLTQAKTVVWNGPLGVFEVSPFAQGTLAVARLLAEAT
ncbi:MAG: phosphoglycerate kinase, partial [Elusimicrobia bacterium]|nr:phosphoglycerate kinase [Elusimicrobiota bacterium]